jgi:DNA-binding NtrC family response regulator
LRTLQEHTVRRLGDHQDRQVDLRVVAATNRPVEEDVSFRRDLYYRLAELTIQVPPLRDRPGDLELLIPYFIHRFSVELESAPRPMSEESLRRLARHGWPGNIRELQNRLHRALLMAEGAQITPLDLGFDPEEEEPFVPLGEAKECFIRDYVRRALVRAGGDRAQAAKDLAIGLRSLYRYLQPGRGEE